MSATSRTKLLLLAIAAIGLAALACAQSGEILPDAEATLQAIPTATPVVDVSAEAEYQVGEQAQIFGGSFGALVPLYGEPGGRFFSSQIPNGSLVSILQLGQGPEGDIWYEVEGNAGKGWIRVENLQVPDIDLGGE
jgi:hypothetical protein